MRNLLAQHLTPDHLVELSTPNREDALEKLVRILEPEPERKLLDLVLERERIQSTGVGQHIAVPHVKLKDAQGIQVVMGISRAGIDWQAIDDKPVHIAFLVVADLARNREYLHLLGDIVRHFNRIERVQALLELDDINKMQALVFDWLKPERS